MSNGFRVEEGRQSWRFASLYQGTWYWHAMFGSDNTVTLLNIWDYPRFKRRTPSFPRPTSDAHLITFERYAPLMTESLSYDHGSLWDPQVREGPPEYVFGYSRQWTEFFPAQGVWADSLDMSSEADARDDLYRVIENLSGRTSQTAASVVDSLKEPREIIRRVRQIIAIVSAIKRFDVKALKKFGLSNREIRHWKGKPYHVRMSSMWLSVSFGIKPALEDIQYACKVLNGEVRKSGTRVRARSGSELHAAWGSAYLNTAAGGPSLEQFGVRNLSEIAWEVLPFSFVVDYVWNVGGFLKAIGDQLLLSEQQYGYKYVQRTLYRLQQSPYWTSDTDPVYGMKTVVTRVGTSNPALPITWRSWSTTLTRFFNAFSVLSTFLDSKSNK